MRGVWFSGSGDTRALARSHDWSSSTLGPIESWPASLHTAVDIMLSTEAPIAVFWGASRVMLYNDAYAELLGELHPAAFGQPGDLALGARWESLEPFVGEVMRTGEGCGARSYPEPGADARRLAIDTSYAPIHGEGGSVVGVFCILQPVRMTLARGSSSQLDVSAPRTRR